MSSVSDSQFKEMAGMLEISLRFCMQRVTVLSRLSTIVNYVENLTEKVHWTLNLLRFLLKFFYHFYLSEVQEHYLSDNWHRSSLRPEKNTGKSRRYGMAINPLKM
jgi:hypothetical protein